MGWFAFAYRIGDRPEEHELEEFPGAGDAQRYAAQNLALMLEGGEDYMGSVAVGAAADARSSRLTRTRPATGRCGDRLRSWLLR